MIGGVSGVGQYYVYGAYSRYPGGGEALSGQGMQGVQGTRNEEIVQGAKDIQSGQALQDRQIGKGTDKVRYAENPPAFRLGADPVEMAVRMRIQYPGEQGKEQKPTGAESVQKAYEDGQCETCKRRKYQDGSDDSGVSYQTPTHIAPERAAAAVRGHEMEHVVRETAKAEREDRKVVSQSVMIHTDICPECGRVYISGGTTRTTTVADTQPQTEAFEQEEDKPFSIAA